MPFWTAQLKKKLTLLKKMNSLKPKPPFYRKRIDFGRKGNNWIEPLKNWILTANYAEKLASSNDFDEIKSFAEKIGTNRRLLDRKLIFDFVRPFDLIPKYKEICEASRAEGEASEQTNSPHYTTPRLTGPNPLYIIFNERRNL
jgi:hypothetical protein